MKISDRLLRQYLDHVYWICGGPCGGKSTMTKLLSSKWDMNYYSSDDHTFDYQKKANPQDHPAILRHFIDWEWFFLGRGNDRSHWLNSVFDESVEFIILDLLQMGKEKPIVVDTFMEPAYLRENVDPNRVVYMFAEDDLIRAEYLDRDHLRGMEDVFPNLSDPQRVRDETLNTVVRASNHYLQQAEQYQLKWFMRTSQSNKDQMLLEVEKHFGFL